MNLQIYPNCRFIQYKLIAFFLYSSACFIRELSILFAEHLLRKSSQWSNENEKVHGTNKFRESDTVNANEGKSRKSLRSSTCQSTSIRTEIAILTATRRTGIVLYPWDRVILRTERVCLAVVCSFTNREQTEWSTINCCYYTPM